MDVDFFIIDLRFIGTSNELYAEVLKNVKSSFKEFSYLKACLLGKDPYVVSVVSISSTVEVILPPQRFNLISFQKAIDQLQYHCDAEVPQQDSTLQAVSSLEQVAKLAKQIKKKNPEVSTIRASCLSASSFLPSSAKTNSIVQAICDEVTGLDFYRLLLPLDQTAEEISDTFANFLSLTSSFTNCFFHQIDYSKLALQNLTKHFVTSASAKDIDVLLTFSAEEQIECRFYKPFFDLSNIPRVEICLCHNKRVSQPSSTLLCATTSDALSMQKVTQAFQIGTLTVHLPEISPTAILQIVSRVKIDTLSTSLLYGEAYYLNATRSDRGKFAALNKILIEQNEALLATTLFDIGSGDRTFMKQHFILIPSDSGSMLVMKIVTEEQVKPSQILEPVVPTEENIANMKSVLDLVGSVKYEPLEFSGELYSQLEHSIPSNFVDVARGYKEAGKKTQNPIVITPKNPTGNTTTGNTTTCSLPLPTPLSVVVPNKPKKMLHPARRIIIDD